MGKHFLEYALFGMNKKQRREFPAAVSRETLVTIEFTGHELTPAFALGLADDDRIIIFSHQLLHIKERLGKGGADGLELAKVSDDGQNGLLRAFAVHIGVQAKGFNTGFLPVFEVLDVEARQPGEAVKGFLVFAEVLDVGFDDGHGVFLLLIIFGVQFSTHTSRRSCRWLELVLK